MYFSLPRKFVALTLFFDLVFLSVGLHKIDDQCILIMSFKLFCQEGNLCFTKFINKQVKGTVFAFNVESLIEGDISSCGTGKNIFSVRTSRDLFLRDDARRVALSQSALSPERPLWQATKLRGLWAIASVKYFCDKSDPPRLLIKY